MTRFRLPFLLLALVFGTAAWYWFRPERAFLDMRVSEAAPAEALVVASGEFVGQAHDGRGRAEILRLADGRHAVRFTRFETLNGPDLRVYLLGDTLVRGDKALVAAGYLDLGELKGNVGDQTYEIPDGTRIEDYRAVSVWCRRFGVNFTTAVLESPRPTSAAR